MMTKVVVQREKPSGKFDNEKPVTYFETVHEVTSEDDAVIAGFLRALANRLDPQKAVLRASDS